LNFPVSIKTTADIINDAIEDVDIVADSVTFQAEPNKFTVEAEGNLSNAHIEIPSDDTTKIESPEKTRAKYSIEYLKKIITGSKIAKDVTIQFNKDYPLRLDFIELDKVLLSFILAPRVEND